MESPLFSPCEVAGLALKNRVVMAPMTRARAASDGVPRFIAAEYYAQRAEAGLIISEGTNISPQGQGFPNTPGIFNAEQVAGWRPILEAVHAQGARFFMQLWHVGRIAHPDSMRTGLHPVAPSAIAYERDVMTPNGLQPAPEPREMTVDEIAETVAEYGRAAARAIEAGCDGVEIHAANGYLPSQFLHETSNLRTDGYGGDETGRIRFVLEVVEACVAAVGAERVGIRFTPFGGFNGCSSANEDTLYRALFAALGQHALAYVHVVGANIAGNKTKANDEIGDAPDVAEFTRPLWPRTLIVGGDFDRARAEAVLTSPGADLVAFGRDFIGNPDLVTRMRDNLPLTPRDPDSWYGDGAEGYTDFPRAAEVTS